MAKDRVEPSVARYIIRRAEVIRNSDEAEKPTVAHGIFDEIKIRMGSDFGARAAIKSCPKPVRQTFVQAGISLR